MFPFFHEVLVLIVEIIDVPKQKFAHEIRILTKVLYKLRASLKTKFKHTVIHRSELTLSQVKLRGPVILSTEFIPTYTD